MSLNSSNGSQIVLPSSVLGINEFIYGCLQSTVGIYNMTVYTVISILLLCIYIPIIDVGRRRWQRCGTQTSHSDFITYQVVIIELAHLIGCILCCCGIYADIPDLIVVGSYFFPFKLTAQMLFHILTCMERYLAVVHPVTYLGLKTANMIRVRNAVFGFTWFLSALSMGTMNVVDELALIAIAGSTIFACLLVIFFFSISVLRVLIQTKPGDRVGDRQAVHQTKLRAFYTIITILALLLLRSGSNLLTLLRLNSLKMGEDTKCGMWLSIFWFCLPSSLVLPLLFLQRAGRLACFRKNSNSAQSSD